MKKLLIFMLTLTTVALAAFEIGKSDAVIYHTKTNANAAKRLAAYLHRVFGKNYTVKAYNYRRMPTAPGIYIGISHPAFKGKTPASADKEFCALHATETQLFLLGNDSRRLKGSLFAVYDFLDKYCGVRFLWPGELGTVADKRPPVKISPRTEVYIPPFDLRMTNSYVYSSSYLSNKARGELHAWLDAHKVGRSLASSGSGFQHAFEQLMPRSVYGKEHPEYYSLVTPRLWIGEPKPAVATRRNDPLVDGTWQLCTSNKDVRRIIAEKLAKPKDGKIRSISPNDGNGMCECKNCLAQDGKDLDRAYNLGKNPIVTNRMYDFAEDIAKQVYKLNPKAKIGMFAYSYYSGVPDQKISFPGNMYLSFCYMTLDKNRQEEEALAKHIIGLANTGAKVIGREYWGCHYMMNYPVNHSRKITRNVKLLHKLNAAGIYGESCRDFSTRATDFYILNKLSWNPTLSREALLKEFCDAAFGPKASPVMYEFFEKIEDRVENHFEHRFNQKGVNFQFYNNGYAERNRSMSELFNEDFQKMCAPYLARAAKLADTPERKARVAFFAKGIKFTSLTTNSLRALRKLASVGVNMPLTQPDAELIPMTKANIYKIAQQAAKAEGARKTFMAQCNSDDHEFFVAVYLNGVNMRLRPWTALSELAVIQLGNGSYNYMVNNAFEYGAYSWETKALKGKAESTVVLGINRDDPNNVMVSCHSGQGRSMLLTLAPGAKMSLTNLRPQQITVPMTADLSFFVRCEGDPSEQLTVQLGDRKLKAVWVDRELSSDKLEWKEIRCGKVVLQPGEYQLKITAANRTAGLFSKGKEVTFNFDDFKIYLKESISATK